MAKKKHARHMSAPGCLLEIVGLFALFIFPIGTVIGIILLIVGARMTYQLVCSECGNKIIRTSKLCPACRTEFGKKVNDPPAPRPKNMVGKMTAPPGYKR